MLLDWMYFTLFYIIVYKKNEKCQSFAFIRGALIPFVSGFFALVAIFASCYNDGMEGQIDECALERALRRFGKSSWREGQRELIRRACAGYSVLGVLPTGYGKSLCYQIAAELLGGLSLVVSPLIALMRDQVQGLCALGVQARRFDSTLTEEEREEVLSLIASSELRLLYVAPESLEQPALVELLERARLGLLVVDEAHCVSEWGHSFRPDYLKLPDIARRYAFHAVMAVTATATRRVQEDLCASFAIDARYCVILSPYRENIVRRVQWAEQKEEALLDFLREPQRRPAIVYCRTRQATEQLAAYLAAQELAVGAYHAGLPAELREQMEGRFLCNELSVLVATVAFGMGVDKPDVRSVIHYHAPATPEAYVQESGRAGRDGAHAESLVLLHGDDARDIRNRIAAAQPDEQSLLRCVRWLIPEYSRLVSLWELTTECDLLDDVPARALRLMEGHVERKDRLYKYYRVRPLFALSTILDGRGAEEVARLRWLDAHREGGLEELAEAWGCDVMEALSALQECEQSQEWTLKLRQQAWLLRRMDDALQPRDVAAALLAYYRAQEQESYARWEEMERILRAEQGGCMNAALERYFMDSEGDISCCGHCSSCLDGALRGTESEGEQGATLQPEPPLDSALPHPLSERQRRRFLLGMSSPALMRRRLWAHPLYGCCAGASWEDL